jgi:hypothetical protein
MFGHSALLILALTGAQPTDGGLLVGSDKGLRSNVHLVETPDTVEFVFAGPDYAVPSISIDLYRNGQIDPGVDFTVSFEPDGAPCLSMFLTEGKSSTCRAPGRKATIAKSGTGDDVVTTFTLPKREISGDGFGFGFAVSLWNTRGNYGTSLGGGDYRFGGEMHLVDGPNFTGDGPSALPPEIMPAVHRYQGCIHVAISALEPIDKTKLASLKSVTTACSTERKNALDEGISALAASGSKIDVAKQVMSEVLDQIDKGTDKFVEMAEKLSREQKARPKRPR